MPESDLQTPLAVIATGAALLAVAVAAKELGQTNLALNASNEYAINSAIANAVKEIYQIRSDPAGSSLGGGAVESARKQRMIVAIRYLDWQFDAARGMASSGGLNATTWANIRSRVCLARPELEKSVLDIGLSQDDVRAVIPTFSEICDAS